MNATASRFELAALTIRSQSSADWDGITGADKLREVSEWLSVAGSGVMLLRPVVRALGQAAILIPRVVCNFASKPRRQGKCLPLATQLNLGNDQSGVVADMGYAPQSAQRFLDHAHAG